MFEKIPQWVVSGIMIFPVIILIGIVLSLATFGNFYALYWVILPSLMFEELFEVCCRAFSDSDAANIIFTFIFWFGIGAVTHLFSSAFDKK